MVPDQMTSSEKLHDVIMPGSGPHMSIMAFACWVLASPRSTTAAAAPRREGPRPKRVFILDRVSDRVVAVVDVVERGPDRIGSTLLLLLL